jgi:hypothetical protein
MTIDEEMKIPYVSKELCEYLRRTFTLQACLSGGVPELLTRSPNVNNDCLIGCLAGINATIERLEAINRQQEEDNGFD